MSRTIARKSKNRYPEFEILEYIREKPNGVTITEISKKKGFSRNTVSKYVSILEIKKKIISKKVGAYNLYFSTELKFFSKTFTIFYYKALLAGLKENFPNTGEIFKNIGRNCLEYIDFYLSPTKLDKLKGMKVTRIWKLYYDVFGKFYPSLNIIQPTIKVRTKKKNGTIKIILRFSNSEFIDITDDFIYHYYITAGLIEAIWKKESNIDVVCNIEKVHLSDKKESSYVELSINFEKEIEEKSLVKLAPKI
ncbi:MAG: hypothetical protein ACFFAH_03380 [Promethearchaeota archaeon]